MTTTPMTADDEKPIETRAFEADVAKLLHLMMHAILASRSLSKRC